MGSCVLSSHRSIMASITVLSVGFSCNDDILIDVDHTSHYGVHATLPAIASIVVSGSNNISPLRHWVKKNTVPHLCAREYVLGCARVSTVLHRYPERKISARENAHVDVGA